MTKLANVIPVYECNAADHLASEAPNDCLGAKPDWTIERFTVEGLKQWRKITDTALIATAPQHIKSLYARLRQASGLRIIGGTKSSYPPEGPNSEETWNAVGSWVIDVMESTSQIDVWIDNETTFQKFNEGKVSVDVAAIETFVYRQLGPLFQGWFAVPNILREPHLREKSARLVRAFAQATPGAKFVTTYTGFGPDGLWPDRAEAQQAMWELVGKLRCIPMAYVRMDGHWPDSADTPRMRVWTPAEFLTALGADVFTLTRDELGKRDNQVLVYGGGDFMRCAREFQRLLS